MLLRLIFGNELEKMITSVINGFAREKQDRAKQCGAKARIAIQRTMMQRSGKASRDGATRGKGKAVDSLAKLSYGTALNRLA